VGLQLVLAGLALVAVLAWIWSPIWNWERHALPGFIVVNEVLASSSTSGFGEGCWSAVYKLSEITASQIRQGGVSYLEKASIGQDSKTRFRKWAETPGRIDLKTNGTQDSKHTIFGLYAMDGCNAKDSGEYRSNILAQALTEPGSYYAVTDDFEGIVLLFPKLHLAAFYYFG
jgi:hypothetical protein